MYTKTENRILKLLSDGQPHKKVEVLRCLDDKLADPSALKDHLRRIRKKLPEDQTILYRLLGKCLYCQHVCLLSSSEQS